MAVVSTQRDEGREYLSRYVTSPRRTWIAIVTVFASATPPAPTFERLLLAARRSRARVARQKRSRSHRAA